MLVIVNVFTWPQPAVRFGYEAAPNETGGDLKAKLATHVGYLALDVQLLAPSGKQIAEGVTLRDQGLRPGDEVRLARRTKLPPGAAAGGPADPTLAPSCASLKHFHSGFALNCLEEHPKAPVLLRMLQLNHGMLPNLNPPGGVPGCGGGPDLTALLAGVGGSQPGIANGGSLAAALGASPHAQVGQTMAAANRAAQGAVLSVLNGGGSISGDVASAATAAMLQASGGGGGGVSALERALLGGAGGGASGMSRRPGSGGGVTQMQTTTLAEFAGELPQARAAAAGAAGAAARRAAAGRRSGDGDASLVLDDIFDFLVDWDDRPENPQHAATDATSAAAAAGMGPRAAASAADEADGWAAETVDASAPPGADNSDAGSSSSVDAHSRATERTAELEVPSAKRLRRDAAGSTEPTSDSDDSNSMSNGDSLSSGSGDAGSDGAGSADAAIDWTGSD